MPRNGKRGRPLRVVVGSAVILAAGLGLAVGWPRLFPGPVARGLAAYNRGDWRSAAEHADARLKEAPNDPLALRLRARATARQGSDDGARAIYARLGGASALEAEDYFLVGNLMDRSGIKATARECWQAGLRADPNHPGLLDHFARHHLAARELTLAAAFARRLATRPGWATRGGLLLAQIASEQDDPAEAATRLRGVLDRDPSSRDAQVPEGPNRKLLARFLLRTGRAAEAGTELRRVLAAGPDREASWLLSRSALQAGSTADASAALGLAAGYRDEHPLDPEPAPYVGAARCAGCHQIFYGAQQSSLHARTFQRDPRPGDLPLPRRPMADPANQGVTHTIEHSGARVRFETRERDRTVGAVIDYLFGSGHRGITMVGRDGERRARELRLSYYADGPVWDLTSGHPAVPGGREGYLGRFLAPDDVQGCLSCHTTVASAARDGTGPVSADRSIGCERCHGPGGNHLAAVEARSPDPAIAQPRLASGAQVVGLCAGCHSPFGRDVSPSDPLAVRFPGTALTWSRCFTASKGAFDCRTCHDPHANAETSHAYYESRCLTCHGPPEKVRTAGTADVPLRTVCPVNPRDDCIKCHMPSVKTSVPHSLFTDHHIRVHPRPGPDAKNSRP